MSEHPPHSVPVPSGQGPPTLGELAPQYGRAVYATCLSLCGNAHDAEDLTQEVFAKALVQWPRLRDPRVAGPWLLEIARTTCVDHLRRRRRTVPLPPEIPSPPAGDDQTREHVLATIRRLPPEHAQILHLYYLDGRRCDAVARVLGISPVAVRQRLVRARLLLHQLLTEERP